MIGNWNYPTPTRFGAGRIAELPLACRELGIKRPLFATDPGLARLDVAKHAVRTLEDAGFAVVPFSDLRPNPTGANVDAGVAVFRERDCDGVVAFGGGAALDVGKAIALMARQRRPLWDFEDREDWCTRVDPDGMAPCVAVPTTSGTGSEMGRASVIVDEATHTKKIIFHPGMLPGRVICDPALTVGLPANVTAWVGIDALSHCLEAYCAPGFHPLADGIAVEGMRLVREALVRAVRDGADLEARAMMMAASSMGATAFQKGLGGMHAMAHPIGAVLDAHHGLTNAIVMPYVLAHNREAISERIARLSRYMGLDDASFDGFLGWVLALREQVRIPHTLAALGMDEARCAELAPMAAADPSAGGNPVKLDAAALEGLYLRATAGEL